MFVHSFFFEFNKIQNKKEKHCKTHFYMPSSAVVTVNTFIEDFQGYEKRYKVSY